MTENDVSYQIRGAIYDVYKALGPGLLESVYEEALAFELTQRGLHVTRQQEVPVNYKGNTLHTPLRLDMIVEDMVIIELKSVKELQDIHFKQLLTYLRLMNKHLGILVNFNCNEIFSNIKRIVN